MKLVGVIAFCVLAAVVNCDVEKTVLYGIKDYITAAQPRGTNVTDGAPCEINIASTWLDLVLVLEATSTMAYQWPALVASIMTYLKRIPLSNSADVTYTTRIAVITYDDSSMAQQHFYFTDRQDLKNIYFALHAAKPNGTGSKGNIASGFRLAHEHLNKNPSFRVKGVVLYAATYDDSENISTIEAANELKADSIKIMTVSFGALDGVDRPKISAIASPGLDVTSACGAVCFAATVALINCRCPSGWTQFVTGNTTYADCFQNRDHLAGCDNGTILAVANTPARFNFIIQLALNWTTAPTNDMNIGLTRFDANSSWIWKDGQANNATAFPAFAQTPSETDIYGYLSKKDNYHWQLLSDDSLATRNFVCQRCACDSSNICDLNI